MILSQNILEVHDLKKYFPVGEGLFKKERKYLKAVDGASLVIEKGKTFGIVGESGCGKSTLARTIIGLYEKTDGKVIFDGKDTGDIKDKQALKRNMQMIFQDPYTSLNPKMTLYDILEEPFRAHKIGTGRERKETICDFLERVGMNESFLNRYPHEFSGGQRQRLGIARALILKPKLVICDEPISALDVSIQAQVINLLKGFQQSFSLSYLFIAHDLSMVKYISDTIGVMYLGNMVEVGEKNKLFEKRLHPYTEALLSAEPVANPRISSNKNFSSIEGEIPSPLNPPSGCKFRTRCKKAMDLCSRASPVLTETEPGYFVACHLENRTILHK